MFNKIINFIFSSNSCSLCKNYSLSNICEKCKEKIFIIYEPFCIYCQNRSLEGVTHSYCYKKYLPNSLIVPFMFSGIVKNCIYRSKYKKPYEFILMKEIARYAFYFKEQLNLHLLNGFIVTPIPTDVNRYKKRGFNPPSLIAKEISSHLSLQSNDLLVKVKSHPSLTQLKKKERKEAVRNSFGLNTKELPPKVLLVDDILTTGSTLMEASRILKRGGCKEVICFSLSYRPKVSSYNFSSVENL